MLAQSDANRMKFAKILMLVLTLVIAVPLLLVGVGLIIGGFFVPEEAVTDDGMSLSILLWGMGAIFLVSGVFTLGIEAAVFWFIGYLFKGAQARQAKFEELQERGLKGTAKVVELIDTGMLVNYNPRVTLVLDVTVQRQPAYEVRKTETIPMTRLPQVQPGEEIDVVVDPDDRENPDSVFLVLK